MRCVYTRNGSIYIIKYIGWKWWFIYAYILKATCHCRYFHWTCFDNSIHPVTLFISQETEGLFSIIGQNNELCFFRHIFHIFCKKNMLYKYDYVPLFRIFTSFWFSNGRYHRWHDAFLSKRNGMWYVGVKWHFGAKWNGAKWHHFILHPKVFHFAPVPWSVLPTPILPTKISVTKVFKRF